MYHKCETSFLEVVVNVESVDCGSIELTWKPKHSIKALSKRGRQSFVCKQRIPLRKAVLKWILFVEPTITYQTDILK